MSTSTSHSPSLAPDRAAAPVRTAVPRHYGRYIYLAINTAILVFLLAPIAVVVVFALNPTPFIQFPPVGVSLRWFEKFFASRDFMQALGFSLEVAVLTTVSATVLGASAALALARGNLPGTRLIVATMLSPLMLPAILTGLALFQTYVLLDVGRPTWGLVAGHTLVTLPYVVRTTLAVLHNFDTRLEEAAQNLGASPLRTFFEVTLPLIKPGVLAGAIFAFIVSFDQFPVSLFLVSPGNETLPVTLFNYLKFDLDGTIGAASVVSIVLAFVVVIGLDRTVGLRSYVKL
ncbi:ABC transporter permease [Bradyrhizobium sp. LTSP849]|jgi:putative spermidine/putrescine transport system permease protein|uniref:ABC transporter permease n=1 Tax=unclassified Bradyrhizobium TaxID=2631580 RepID=UPI0005D28334|nr:MULTISPECIES: ABC transporter permease [unclassified Bradyrhizobium]KJC41175.1 ABC transporter permease [Bradyrhizobium sp. LTSP857]KJC48372.1 ABC transporter permease [Bradyrhizobium sp. LTSP849]